MFTEKTMDSMVYLVSDRIGVKHGFTTRYGGVSTGIYSSLNVGENRGDDPACVRENYARVGKILGVGPDDFATTRQIHEATVRVADNGDRRKVFDPVPYDADGLVTNVPGLPMMIYIADCIPVLLCDDRHGVIGGRCAVLEQNRSVSVQRSVPESDGTISKWDRKSWMPRVGIWEATSRIWSGKTKTEKICWILKG